SNLIADLRERFATDNWAPVKAHEVIAEQLSALESQAQGLLFSRVRAYLGELDALRVQFGDFITGPAPQIAEVNGSNPGEIKGPNFKALYDWTVKGFAASVERLRARRTQGQLWRHPTRKSQSWTDLDGQVHRAFEAASSTADFSTICRVGELLLLMRQGFI